MNSDKTPDIGTPLTTSIVIVSVVFSLILSLLALAYYSGDCSPDQQQPEIVVEMPTGTAPGAEPVVTHSYCGIIMFVMIICAACFTIVALIWVFIRLKMLTILHL